MQLKQVKYDLDGLELKEIDQKNYEKKINLNYLISQGSSNVANQQIKFKFEKSIANKMLSLRFKLMTFTNSMHDLLFNQVFEFWSVILFFNCV